MADKLPWFRTYTEAATDPKFDLIAAQTGIHQLTVFGAWFKLLCIAGASPVRGSLYVTSVKRYSNNDVAMLLRLGNKECEDLIKAFIEMDMMYVDPIGALAVKNWNKRQFESDNSTKRVQKHRKTVKTKQNETPVKRYSNVPETPSDTDTDTDTDTEKENKQQLPNIFDLYQKTFGNLAPMLISQELLEVEKDYPADWIEDAFKETAKNNARSWNYTAEILKRWKSQGRNAAKMASAPAGYTPYIPEE